jgi:hypothetical protein
MTTQVQDIGFAKIFQFSDGNQMVAYADPTQEKPCLKIQAQHSGIIINSNMVVDGLPEKVEPEMMKKIFSVLLEGLSVDKADDLHNAYAKHLDKVPVLEFRKILQMFQLEEPDAKFARVAEADGQKILVLRDQKDDQPVLTVVSEKGPSTLTYASARERDRAFAQNQWVEALVPAEAVPEVTSTPRRLKP